MLLLFSPVLNYVLLFVTPWTAARQTSLSFTILWNLLIFMSTELVMLFKHLIFCFALLLLPSIFPSIRVFSNELALHIRWPTYWSFSISPSNEYSGLISFRIDWFDFFAVQGTLKSLLQHHNLRALILQHLAFLMGQLSHLYMTTGKTMALSIQNFAGKAMTLLFNTLFQFSSVTQSYPTFCKPQSTLFRFVIAFLPRSKHLLISWLQTLYTIISEPEKIKSFTVSTFSPSICHEMMGLDAVILFF